MIGIEGSEISRNEYNPQESCSGNRYEDVPRFIEILRQFSGQKSINSTENDEGQVVGQWYEQSFQGQVTEEFHMLLSWYLHPEFCDRWYENTSDNGQSNLKSKQEYISSYKIIRPTYCFIVFTRSKNTVLCSCVKMNLKCVLLNILVSFLSDCLPICF